MFYWNFQPQNKIDLTIRLILVWLSFIPALLFLCIKDSIVIKFRWKRAWDNFKRQIKALLRETKKSYEELK